MIQLPIPIEVWMDILDWLRAYRRQLASKCNQLGDRTFVEFCQHWLHEYCMNVLLGDLYIDGINALNRNGVVEKRSQLNILGDVRVPFATVPMPENIRTFTEIRIDYLDYRVLRFLRQGFFANNRNNNILLDIDPVRSYEGLLREMRVALGHLLPLLSNGIERINFCRRSSSLLAPVMDQFPEQLFSVKLLLFTSVVSLPNVRQIVHWLCTRRADTEPRMAFFYKAPTSTWPKFPEVVREQFLAATSPVSFFLRIDADWPYPRLEEFEYKNRITGEKLLVQSKCNGDLLIGRCPSRVNGNQWLQEMCQKVESIRQQKQQKILLHMPKFGPMESGEEEEGNDDYDADADQPGPSKRQKLS